MSDPRCRIESIVGSGWMGEMAEQRAATVNVAATCASTATLGPGPRAVVWVQGCPFRCPGCTAPEWIPDRPAERIAPSDLAARLLGDADVTGFTFSGGEPMEQAAALAETIIAARRQRDLSLVCFTGHRLERLRARPPGDGAVALLDQVDVLVDGLYVRALDDDRGLRGSTNQRIHHLTDRLRDCDYDFEGRPRDVEIRLTSDSIQMVGVPTHAATAAVDAIAPRSPVPPRGRSTR